MSRPTERDHRCTDLDLLLPLQEQGYRSLQASAAILGVPYPVLRRVAHGQACTQAEEVQVRQAWASYSPDAVHELIDAVLGATERGDPVHPAYAKQLRGVVGRLLEQVAREVEL